MRADLRNWDCIRDITAQLGVIQEADGSAQLETGKTKVIASVVGPAQPRFSRLEEFDRASVEVEVEIVGKSANEVEFVEKAFSRYIRNIIIACVNLSGFPRMTFFVKCLVTVDDGSSLCSAANAAVLSFLDAGIEMTGVPLSISYVSNGTQQWIDPTLEEESEAVSKHTITVMGGKILATESSGGSSIEELVQIAELGTTHATIYDKAFRTFLKAKLIPDQS